MENLWSNVPSLQSYFWGSKSWKKSSPDGSSLLSTHLSKTFSRLLRLIFFTIFFKFCVYKMFLQWLKVALALLLEVVILFCQEPVPNKSFISTNKSTLPFRYISTWPSLSLKSLHAHLCLFSRNWLIILSLLFLGQDSCNLFCLYNPAIWSRDVGSNAVFNNIATDYELALCKGASL